MISRVPTLARLATALVVASAFMFSAAARADDYTDQANKLYATYVNLSGRTVPLPSEKRSDLVLLPALAKMQPPPAAVSDMESAALITPKSREWEAAQAWATASQQKAVLEALAAVTKNESSLGHMVFAQPYGVDGVPIDLVAADLYTELGDPPLLAAAEFRYLKSVKNMACLVAVECNRLAADGKSGDALELALRLGLFARQIADRELAGEKATGMDLLAFAFTLMDDIAYRDFKSPTHSLTIEKLQDVVKRLDDAASPIGLARIRIPAADQLAAEQLVARVYGNGDKPNPEIFAATLAKMSVGDRPLRMFSEAAGWEDVRRVAAAKPQTLANIRKVAGDFKYRWGLDPFDPTIASDSDYRKLVAGNPAMRLATVVYRPYPRLLNLRKDLRVQLEGSRQALAMYAYFIKNGTFPAILTGIRPVYIPDLAKDPFDPQGRNFQFFVPSRDLAGGRKIHEMTVFVGKKYKPFAVKLGEGEFVLYSVGPDGDRGWAKDATGGAASELTTGDYVIWPPDLSLLRQHLIQEGQLK
ncbi:MAG: hypothetical protein KF745_06260 [Phycisphaeraceae bacterium]|nr:hypothetical protein [Phycisphaeraceae bacterium]